MGYKPDGRSLAIVNEHAALISDIYQRYLEIGNVRLVADDLAREGILSPLRVTAGERAFGGRNFTRGQIYAILKNPIYVGDIAHRGQQHPGQHSAIIDRETWTLVQERLADHLQGERRAKRAISPSLLAGLIVDEAGEPLVATHACKGKVRYRYYVSRALQHSTTSNGAPGIRLPAREIEAAVAAMIAEELDEPLTLAARAWITIDPSELHRIMDRSAELAAMARKRDRDLVRQLVAQVRVFSSRVEIDLSALAIAELLGTEQVDGAAGVMTLASDMRLTRTGMAVRLIQNDGVAAGIATPDPTLLKLVLKARHWWAQLKEGHVDRGTLAAQEGVTPSYMSRVLGS